MLGHVKSKVLEILRDHPETAFFDEIPMYEREMRRFRTNTYASIMRNLSDGLGMVDMKELDILENLDIGLEYLKLLQIGSVNTQTGEVQTRFGKERMAKLSKGMSPSHYGQMSPAASLRHQISSHKAAARSDRLGYSAVEVRLD